MSAIDMESDKKGLNNESKTEFDFLEEELNIFEKTFEELSGQNENKMFIQSILIQIYFVDKSFITKPIELEAEKKNITESKARVEIKEKPKLLPKPKLYPKPSHVKVGIK